MTDTQSTHRQRKRWGSVHVHVDTGNAVATEAARSTSASERHVPLATVNLTHALSDSACASGTHTDTAVIRG